MAFVHVVCRRLYAYGAQGSNAADAQHDFLADTHVQISGIKPGRDMPGFSGIRPQVRVEQIQGNPSDHDPPYSNLDRFSPYGHLNHDRTAILPRLL